MCVSAASLLQAEYPGLLQTDRWSYPRLAEELRLAGVPVEDRIELFGRMVFNAVCGNDDDHPRNHAVIWRQHQSKWRLSPAFDVVPNMQESPKQLAMQLSANRWDIQQDALLADWRYFGFDSLTQAEHYKNKIMQQIKLAADDLESDGLSSEQAHLLRSRMSNIIGQLT